MGDAFKHHPSIQSFFNRADIQPTNSKTFNLVREIVFAPTQYQLCGVHVIGDVQLALTQH